MTSPHTPHDALTLDGRCFTYVFPCAWEDYCKIGFSHDPLARLRTLHPRWFEFFDLEAGTLVETETTRDARDLELALRRPLKAHRAPAPMTIRQQAGGKTEWVRGANAALAVATRELAGRGYRVHPLRDWTALAMSARLDRLFEWTQAQLPLGEVPGLNTHAQTTLRDALDAHAALDIDVREHVPDYVWDWYRGP